MNYTTRLRHKKTLHITRSQFLRHTVQTAITGFAAAKLEAIIKGDSRAMRAFKKENYDEAVLQFNSRK